MRELAQIMVAPNGARLMPADHQGVPVTVSDLVAEARDCFEAGATAIHAHVRDASGRHVLDSGLYRELITEMRVSLPYMDCQISTEAVGRYAPGEQMLIVRAVEPEHVSIGLRELCREGWTAHVADFYRWCSDCETAVQHILYGERDLDMLTHLVDAGDMPSCNLQMLFVLGRYAERRTAHLSELRPFLDRLERFDCPVQWAVCAFGEDETMILREVMALGGCARIGFENNTRNRDGSIATSNAERVRDLLSV